MTTAHLFFYYHIPIFTVHYTTSCNTQSSAPEHGQNICPKHGELIGITNKPLLLHLVGCLYYLYQWHSQANIKCITFDFHAAGYHGRVVNVNVTGRDDFPVSTQQNTDSFQFLSEKQG